MRVLAFLTAILPAVSGSAWAETAPNPSNPPDKAEPGYRSAFADYRGFKDEPLKAWRESNEAMQHLGGHMGHLNDATVNSDVEPTHREGADDEKTLDGSKP
jgi:hypothetical protein